MKPSVILIAHNLRSTHNVGSLFRTSEGLGITRLYLSGYTPYPASMIDSRLPHLSVKINNQIAKTALGAEKYQEWEHRESITVLISELKKQGYTIVALEQSPHSLPITEYRPPDKIAIIVGREVEGIEDEVLALCDNIVEIPMFGRKESFNVVQAAAMTLYQFRFYNGLSCYNKTIQD